MIRRLFSSQLRINMVSGVGVTLVNIAVLAVAYPMYLHFLGYEQYGVWLVLSTVLTFAQLGNLGIGQAVMKLVAEEYGRHDLEAAQQYMASAVVILMASGGVVFAAILLFRTPIVALFKLSGENARTVFWMLPYMACLSIYVFIVQAVNAMLSGFGRMDLANYAQTGGRLVAVLVAGCLLFLGTGIKGLLIGSAASYVFIHIASLALIRRVAPIRILRTGNLRLARMKQLLGFGLAVFGGSLMALMYQFTNRVLLSRYVGVASLSVFDIGLNASMQVRTLGEAGLRALLPEISRIGMDGSVNARERIAQINRKGMKSIFLFAGPTYAILALFSGLMLKLWLGHQLPAALPNLFRVMLAASFVSLVSIPAYYTLLGLGYVGRSFLGYVVSILGHFSTLALVAALTGHLVVEHFAYGMFVGLAAATFYLLWQLSRSCLNMAVDKPRTRRVVIPAAT